MPVAEHPRTDPSPPEPADKGSPPTAPRHAAVLLIGLLAAVAAVVAALAIALYHPADSTPSAAPQGAPPSPPPGPRSIGGLPAVATSTPGFPAPPRGAVVYARPDRSDALGLAIVPGKPLLLQASVVGPDGKGVSGLQVTFGVREPRTPARETRSPGAACGAGCYTTRLTVATRPAQVEVTVVRKVRTTRWAVTLPTAWPPPSAAAVLRRATRAFHDLRGVSFEERLASSPTAVINTRWRLEAPDRLAYQIHGGAAGIQIGARRWDRAAGAAWQRSEATRLPQPSPQWEAVTDARIIGRRTIRGRAAIEVAFFDSQTPAWFRGAVDAKSFRVLDLRMVATAHFMHDVYGPFNGPTQITPPAS